MKKQHIDYMYSKDTNILNYEENNHTMKKQQAIF